MVIEKGRRDLPPIQLFRYRAYTTGDLYVSSRRSRIAAELEKAQQSQVWFSPLSAQNDPFDTNPNFVDSDLWQIRRFFTELRKKKGRYVGAGSVDMREGARERGISKSDLKKSLDNWSLWRSNARKTFISQRAKQKISCFSSSGMDILMWSYYAQSHSSFCYIFQRHEDELKGAALKVGQVRYVKDRPKISTLDVLKYLSFRDEDGYITEEEDENFSNAFIMTKSDIWQHEGEWRALRKIGDSDGYYHIRPYNLTAIILGCRVGDEMREFIGSHISPNIRILRARLGKTSYSLSISE